MKKNAYILDLIMLRAQGLSQRKQGLSTVKNKKLSFHESSQLILHMQPLNSRISECFAHSNVSQMRLFLVAVADISYSNHTLRNF